MLDKYEDIAITASKKAGIIIKKYFNNIKEFDIKKNAGIVTKADKEAEKELINYFKKYTPNIGILSEEAGLYKKAPSKWIIDPLDGTTNFYHAFPFVNVSIGLEIDGEIVVGVVYNPILNNTYRAILGKGAFKNDKKIKVSKTKKLENALLGTGFAYMRGKELDKAIEIFKKFSLKTHGIRRPGAAALDLCMVAEGVYDGFYEKTLNAWDVSAGYLIIKEAGGKLTNYKGNKFSIYKKELVASNSLIHDEMIKVIN
jgi:myo-inositol-1(or 4)-monophosphatase